VAAQK